jgi:TRAP-type C4-dicarboxylate transport system permease small subunit
MAEEVGRMPNAGDTVEDEVEAQAKLSGAPDTSVLGAEANPELLPRREPFRSALHAIGLIEQAIGTLLLVAILFLVLTQVAQRYIPGQGWPWTGEVARYSMVWAAFVLSGYLVAHDRHIAIHLVDYVLRGRALALVKMLVNVVILATCLGMMYATYDLIASDIGQVTPAAELPLRWVNLPVLIGFALSATRAALGIVVADLPVLINGEEATS